MTTIVDFQPGQSVPFSFQATLDGEQYAVSVPYNIATSRYYVQVSDLSGNLVVLRALTSSTPKTAAAFSWADGIVTAVSSAPHNIPLGSVALVTVSDTGLGYDGVWTALSTDVDTLTYDLAANPGASASGSVSQDVDLVDMTLDGTYFASTLVYRVNTSQFEVTP